MTITTPVPSAFRSRRPYRLGIDAHTAFVAGLVFELDAAVSSLRMDDVRRLISLLDIIDGPGNERYLQPTSLPDVLCQAAKRLDLDADVHGAAGPGHFLCDSESLQLGAELALSAFAGDGGRLLLAIPSDHVVHVEGPFDLTDERRVWQLRCGRRVLEGEGCRIRLMRLPGGYRLEIRAFEP